MSTTKNPENSTIMKEIVNEQTVPSETENTISTTPQINTASSDQPMDDYLRSIGWSQENIDNVKNYNPTQHGSALEFYNKIFTKPEPVDERKVRNAQVIAGIGDALGLVSQMWSSGKGAHIRNREYEQSASSRLGKNVKELDDAYRKRLDDYNKGKYGAAMNDYSNQLQISREIFNAMRGDLKDKKNLDFKNQQEIQKQANWDAKFEFEKVYKQAIQEGKDADRAYKEAQLAAKIRHDKAMEGIGWKNAASTATNAAANKVRAEHQVSGGGNSNKVIPLYFKDGEKIEVPENIWKANFSVLADILTNSGVSTPIGWIRNPPTSQQVEHFIKENKDGLPKEARNFLSGIARGEGTVYTEQQNNSGTSQIGKNNGGLWK